MRAILHLRKFSTSRVLWRPELSAEYKSKKLWEERFSCPLLNDEDVVKRINNKIIRGDSLNNLELDIFVNISSPHTEETVHLEESAVLLNKLRKSLAADTLLPSTPDAVCRLFLASNRLSSLISILNDRVNYGVFPNFFVLNLLLDEALEKNNYAAASKLASLVMLQEEFGTNPITDGLALYSVAKYIESRGNFDDWPMCDISTDPILGLKVNNQVDDSTKDQEENKSEENEDEDEEDAEYIRVPFLRNPYFDNHFDLTDPRKICGKTLSMLSTAYSSQNNEIAWKSKLLGDILQGNWSSASESIENCKKSNVSLGPVAELSKFYLDTLHSVDPPKSEDREALISGLDSLSEGGESLSKLVDSSCSNFVDAEKVDIQQLRSCYSKDSKLRQECNNVLNEKLKRDELIAEIRKKKEDLKLKEQYLYFYDNLKKKKLTRIDYT